MQQYQLSNLPSRYQLAQHYHSSLDQPNLDNVQAKLYAIRQKNYQMAQQFFEQKYGTSVAYDQYLKQSNMTDLIPPSSPYEDYQDQFDLKRHLQEKALQIRQLQMQKLQNNKTNQNKIINKRPASSKKNPWLQTQTNKPESIKSHNRQPTSVKNSNYSQGHNGHYQQQQDYVQQTDPNLQIQVIDLKYQKQRKQQEKKSHFVSQFKQYLMNKNKMKVSEKESKINHQIDSPTKTRNNLEQNNSLMNKSLSKSKNFNNNSLIGLNNASKTSNISQNLKKSGSFSLQPQSTPQQELVKKIFKTINTKSKRSFTSPNQQYIQKIELAQYLTQNQRILDVLNIGSQEIVHKLQNELQTKDSNRIKTHECLMFVYTLLGKEEEQKKLRAKHCFSDIPEGCMLQPEVIKQFQKIFKILDKPCDLIVKRLDFIEKLALDPMLSKIINTPAVYQPHLNKTVSLRRIFQRIQVQSLLCSQQNLKANEYISWAQFIKYFESGHSDRGKYDIIRLIQTLKNQQKMGFADIPQTVYEVIIQAVKKIDKGQQYFNTLDLIGQILINKTYEVQKYSFVRGKGNDPKSGNIPMQTFQQTLTRIKQTAPKFVTIKQLLEFFSTRGQPVELVEQQLQQKIKAQNTFSKVAKVQDEIFGQKNHQIDGYDSDPELYNNSHVVDKREFRKTFADAKKELRGLKIGDTNSFDNRSSENLLLKGELKITVPKPFKFQQRQKQRAQQKSRLNRSESVGHSEYRFKAKQIPQKVKQVGLYEKIIEENIKKIQDRKKCSVLLTLANEQPFSFYNRKAPKKTKQQRKQFIFKANPIPWFCSVDLLKKKQQLQINRNQKIARMAQQSLSKAKLPPRMQKDYQEKLARKNLQQSKQKQRPQSVIKAKQPPNFQQIHKQFQLALQRKRKQNKTTQIKQFNFSQVKRQKKPQAAQIQDQQNQLSYQPKDKQQNWRQTLKQLSILYNPYRSSINIFASSTAKFDQQVQKRRKQRQQKKRIQDQKKKQQQERKKINEQLNKKLQQKTQQKKQNPKHNELLQKKREQMKQQQQQFKQMKKQWLNKASKQPLLVERPLKRDLQIEKMKKLHIISQNLKKNGIKDREHDQYFKKDQLILLKDYQFLISKGEKL